LTRPVPTRGHLWQEYFVAESEFKSAVSRMRTVHRIRTLNVATSSEMHIIQASTPSA